MIFYIENRNQSKIFYQLYILSLKQGCTAEININFYPAFSPQLALV